VDSRSCAPIQRADPARSTNTSTPVSAEVAAPSSPSASCSAAAAWRPTSTLRVRQVRRSPSPRAATAGSTPARHSDDLPIPESPATTTRGAVRSRSTIAVMSVPRP
jgi:hypothetical protein